MKYGPNCHTQEKCSVNHYTPTYKAYAYGYLHVLFEMNVPFPNGIELYNSQLSSSSVESSRITNEELHSLSVLNFFITKCYKSALGIKFIKKKWGKHESTHSSSSFFFLIRKKENHWFHRKKSLYVNMAMQAYNWYEQKDNTDL